MLESKLYEGKVVIRRGDGAHRYQVSVDGGPFETKRGVTTILGQTLAKPALMLWPMDEALRLLFGQEFEEVYGEEETTIRPLYNQKTAVLQPEQSYTLVQLQSLLEDCRSAHTKKRDRGADTGKIAHGLIETYLLTEIDQTDKAALDLAEDYASSAPEAQKAYEAFVKWYESEPNIKTLAAERVVYSRAWGYPGTLDSAFEINGQLVLADVKTSNASRTAPLGIYADNFLQLGAYALAYEEETGKTPADLMVINASKTGKLAVIRASDLGIRVDQCQLEWIHAFLLWEFKDKLGKKLVKLKKAEMIGQEEARSAI